ncbi:MAG: tRNA dihydrouridine synthase DusB [Proteobacteria bacterium]|nr:tRNA dihydrouridine synthase DusB [Pseudomonadota bacterium]MBU1640222.1 tRNA dihydrouridine synthase DusB [Pseudomonadota bacterium]
MQPAPFTIGPVRVENPFILAPLAGYTDLPFRLLCREYGAGLVYSEMISCHGLVYDQNKTKEMIATVAEEQPLALQLFGSEPEIMGQAAAIIDKEPLAMIDINMGCPVRKVIKKGAGSALMQTPHLAEEIIRQVVANTSKPVTIKIRTGWNHNSINAPEFAKMAEEAGAAAVAIHARTWSDGFSGKVDYSVITKVKESLTIPVIGNGDIHSYNDGIKLMAETGCDGVMIGRTALGAPWIFSPSINIEPSRSLRLKALSRHLELIDQFLPADRLLGKIKNHAGKYLKGVQNGSSIRVKIFEAKNFNQLQVLVHSLLDQHK